MFQMYLKDKIIEHHNGSSQKHEIQELESTWQATCPALSFHNWGKPIEVN